MEEQEDEHTSGENSVPDGEDEFDADFTFPDKIPPKKSEAERREETLVDGRHRDEAGQFLSNSDLETVTDEQYFSDKEEAIKAYKRWKNASSQFDILQTEENAKEELERIFTDEFSAENPPESFERFEQQVTLRRLVSGVYASAGGLQVKFDGDLAALVEPDGTAPEANPEHAIRLVRIMGQYGSAAQPYLSKILESPQIPLEVRNEAADQLEAVSRGSSGNTTLFEALSNWWRGE